jgi:3-methyladenine DNA glycosylase AlkD
MGSKFTGIKNAGMGIEEYEALLNRRFMEEGRWEVAEGQEAYMRHRFKFFGVKSPDRTAISGAFHREFGLPAGVSLDDLVVFLWDCSYRELHYHALFVAERLIRRQGEAFIYTLEGLIVRNSWWDTVDWLAKLVGIHFKRFPGQVLPITESWMASGDMWLQRVCLIFQLGYGVETDQDLLFRYVKVVSRSREFFLQKGAGWALRQYSKTNPEAVRAFIAATELSALTRREGLRLMEKRE